MDRLLLKIDCEDFYLFAFLCFLADRYNENIDLDIFSFLLASFCL